MKPKPSRTSMILGMVLLVAAACGGGPGDGLPEGTPLLPDLVPAPAIDFNTSHEDDGSVLLRFSSILVNVGGGDFLVEGSREPGGDWTTRQVISHVGGEDARTVIDAELVWGGDGHDHWHITRVAHYWIVPLDGEGNPVDDDQSRADTKVGFCFFDHLRELDHAPKDPVFRVHDCGDEDDDAISMGMSPGWGDKYLWNLPGQQIEVTDLEDGMYRLWAEADPNRHFVEVSRDNNRTWVDFELRTLEDGKRGALALSTGPMPSDHG